MRVRESLKAETTETYFLGHLNRFPNELQHQLPYGIGRDRKFLLLTDSHFPYILLEGVDLANSSLSKRATWAGERFKAKIAVMVSFSVRVFSLIQF